MLFTTGILSPDLYHRAIHLRRLVFIMSDPLVLISAFADEAANHKTALEQMTALSAIGLRYYSPRFIDVNGSGEVCGVMI